jgi:hypothetical protein
MSNIINQVVNNAKLAIHNATYNPEAEQFAKEQAAKLEREKKAKEAEALREKARTEKLAKEAADKELRDKTNADRDARAKFDGNRLVSNIFSTILKIVLVFILLCLGTFGASLATNLNLYKSTSFRILYAIYGFIFFIVVIPYCLLYRWWWHEKRPRFYALIPLVPYHFDNRWMALFFSWMSYKPDEYIETLKEWQYI